MSPTKDYVIQLVTFDQMPTGRLDHFLGILPTLELSPTNVSVNYTGSTPHNTDVGKDAKKVKEA